MSITWQLLRKVTLLIYLSVLELIQVSYEPVGRWFEACLKRQRSEKSVSFVEELCEKESGSDEDDKELTDEEKSFMLSLDATEWKVL